MTYKALVCERFGDAEALLVRDVARVPLQPGEVRVRVDSAMLTFADGLKTRGAYQIKATLPFVPGGCGCGQIIEVADDVTDIAPGERATFLNIQGACGQETVTRRDSLAPVMPEWTSATATALRLYYPIVYFSIAMQGRLAAGETLLVTGAGGANGIAAIHLGKALGARVIACASTAERLASAREAGADAVVDYSGERFAERILEITDGRGVDVVFEVVGGGVFDEAVRCLADFGRIVVFGFAGGTIPAFKVNRALLRNISVVGANFQRFGIARRPAEVDRIWRQLADWVADGTLPTPVLDHVPLAQSPDVIRRIWSGPLDRPALIDMTL